MSYVLKTCHSSDVQNWVRVNAAGSLKATPRESWRAYLAANSGVGSTLSELEMSFLKAAGATGKTLHDLWGSYSVVSATAGGNNKEKTKNKYR